MSTVPHSSACPVDWAGGALVEAAHLIARKLQAAQVLPLGFQSVHLLTSLLACCLACPAFDKQPACHQPYFVQHSLLLRNHRMPPPRFKCRRAELCSEQGRRHNSGAGAGAPGHLTCRLAGEHRVRVGGRTLVIRFRAHSIAASGQDSRLAACA